MSNEQEMREAIKESISDFRKSVFEFAIKQDKENHEHMIQAQINVFNVIDSATLAAEARIREKCLKVAAEVNDYFEDYAQLSDSKIEKIVDAVLTEHKENQG